MSLSALSLLMLLQELTAMHGRNNLLPKTQERDLRSMETTKSSKKLRMELNEKIKRKYFYLHSTRPKYLILNRPAENKLYREYHKSYSWLRGDLYLENGKMKTFC